MLFPQTARSHSLPFFRHWRRRPQDHPTTLMTRFSDTSCPRLCRLSPQHRSPSNSTKLIYSIGHYLFPILEYKEKVNNYTYPSNVHYYTFVLFPKEFPPTLGLHFSNILLFIYGCKMSCGSNLLLKWNDSRLDLFQGEMIDFFGCAIRQVREMCAEISQQLARDHEANVLIYHLLKKIRDKKTWVIYVFPLSNPSLLKLILKIICISEPLKALFRDLHTPHTLILQNQFSLCWIIWLHNYSKTVKIPQLF